MLKIFVTKLKLNIKDDYAQIFSSYWSEKINNSNSSKRKSEIYTSAFLVKFALKEFDIDEMDVKYYIDANGKPYFSNIDLFYNLSHSDDYVILAISDSNIGVDIQRIKINASHIAKRFFSEDENIYLNSLYLDRKNIEFFKIWTAKEAYLKYTGLGLRKELSSFSVICESTKTYIKNENVNLIYINDIPDYIICLCQNKLDSYEYNYLI